MSDPDQSAQERRRKRREEARRRRRRNRRLTFLAIAALLAVIAAGWFFGIRDSESEGGTTGQDGRGERGSQVVTEGGFEGTEPETGMTEPEREMTEGEQQQLERERERRRKLARQHAREDQAIDRLLRYSRFINNGAGRKRQVALTFDDGPGPSTKQILNILRRTGTPATFFVVGSMVPGNRQMIRRIVREGHAIGNHTQTHPAMGDLGRPGQLAEMTSQAREVEDSGVKQRRLFRPPYRSFNRTTFDLLEKRDELMVLWSVDTEDYATSNPRKIARIVLREVKPGSIVLMHDAGGDRKATVKALPKIIRGLRQRKLRPVTVPRLVKADPPARKKTKRYPDDL